MGYFKEEKFNDGRYHDPISFLECLIRSIQDQIKKSLFTFSVKKIHRCRSCQKETSNITNQNIYGIIQRNFRNNSTLGELIFRDFQIQKKCNCIRNNTFHSVDNYYIIPSECKFLIIQIDIFSMNKEKFKTKIVDFDPDVFSTKAIVDKDGIPINFKLKCGIKYHHQIKHYTAFIRDLSERSWLHVDSLAPTRVEIGELKTDLEDIYGLVFERI
jgi:hypothetical protein